MSSIFAITIEVYNEYDSSDEFSGMAHTGSEQSARALVDKLNDNLGKLKPLACLKNAQKLKRTAEVRKQLFSNLQANPETYPPLPTPPVKGSGETTQEYSLKLKEAKKTRAFAEQQMEAEVAEKIKEIEKELEAEFEDSIKDIDFVSKSRELNWVFRSYYGVGEYHLIEANQV